MSDPFDQLRDLGEHTGAPEPRFVDRLRRQVTEAIIQTRADPSVIDLPDRKQFAMNESTPSPAVQTLTPYITVHDGAAALAWYTEAFGVVETVRYVGDDGRLGHAEFTFAGANVMLSDAYPEMGVVAANSYEGSSCALHIEVADTSMLHDRAVAAGAASTQPPTDQPHGARVATVIDPFGHRWMLSQQIHQPSTSQIDAAYDDFSVIESDAEPGATAI